MEEEDKFSAIEEVLEKHPQFASSEFSIEGNNVLEEVFPEESLG